MTPPQTNPQPGNDAPCVDSSDAPDVLTGPFYVDTHVHIYPAFDAVALLDAALANVRKYGHEPGAMPVLMLTECRDDHVFAQWADAQRSGPWQINSCDQAGVAAASNPVLFATREGKPNQTIALVAGRQIITNCRLEVLALGTDDTIPDGLSLDETIEKVRGRSALPVVPYGFGKWTGTRGTAVSRLIEAQSLQNAPRLVLGDNGGRPTLGPRPAQFDQAAAHRVTILPGTDPLPLRSCQHQAGRFGACVEGPIPSSTFVTELLNKLAALGPVPPRFGDHISLARAIYQQVALRLDRRLLGGKGRL